jgi:uncharacterized OB-fold protein
MTAMTTAGAPAVSRAPDPRPRLVADERGDWLLEGARCEVCEYPTPERLDRCPVCRGPAQPARFGPAATVFAATVLRVPVEGRTPPYAITYVDLDEGPRILAHLDRADEVVEPRRRVRLVGISDHGDPLVTAVAPDEQQDSAS